jgi:hypothetical protein
VVFAVVVVVVVVVVVEEGAVGCASLLLRQT